MILKSMNPVFGGWNGRATIQWSLPSSGQKNPVLFIDGTPISPQETALAGLNVVKANKREMDLLKKGGYIK